MDWKYEGTHNVYYVKSSITLKMSPTAALPYPAHAISAVIGSVISLGTPELETVQNRISITGERRD